MSIIDSKQIHRLSQVTVKTSYVEGWSEWSEWSSEKIEPSDIIQVETDERESENVSFYNMGCYVTQAEESPYNKQYRNYSVNEDFDAHGLRKAYGEHYVNRLVTPDELSKAKWFSQVRCLIMTSVG